MPEMVRILISTNEKKWSIYKTKEKKGKKKQPQYVPVPKFRLGLGLLSNLGRLPGPPVGPHPESLIRLV
jgi:hypothetical protein